MLLPTLRYQANIARSTLLLNDIFDNSALPKEELVAQTEIAIAIVYHD
jgi:hypothetical protein